MNLEKFLSDFRFRLTNAVRSDYGAIRKKLKSDHPYVCALVTDSDVATIFLAVNTLEYLEKMKRKTGKESKDIFEEFGEFIEQEGVRELLESSIAKIDAVQWMPDEWGYSDSNVRNSEVKRLSRYLDDNVENLRKSYSEEKLKEKIINEMILSLRVLSDEGFWGNEDERNVTLFVSISDDDSAVDIQKKSSEILNPANIHKEFLKALS